MKLINVSVYTKKFTSTKNVWININYIVGIAYFEVDDKYVTVISMSHPVKYNSSYVETNILYVVQTTDLIAKISELLN